MEGGSFPGVLIEVVADDDRGSCRVAEGNTSSGLPTSNFVLKYAVLLVLGGDPADLT